MMDSRAALLRRLWLNLHLWIDVGLGLLIVPIALSGCALVFHDGIDAWLRKRTGRSQLGKLREPQ